MARHRSPLTSRTSRSALPPSDAPVWEVISPGVRLGYRRGRGTNGRGGTWLASCRTPAGARIQAKLGRADDIATTNGMSHEHAKDAARLWAKGIRACGSTAAGLTVNAALDRYMEDQEFNTGKPLKDAHSRINLHIRPALGKVLVCELTLERIKTWRNGLVTKPKHQRTGKRSKKTTVVVDLNDQRIRDRRKDTANRIFSTLRAALNFACQEDLTVIKVWTAVKPFENVGQPRVNYLEIPDQRKLLAIDRGAIRDLIEAALLTGCRFGELARFRVSDFDSVNGSLFVWESKSKKARHIWLSTAGVGLFKRLATDRDCKEPLLRQPSGTAWKPSSYQRPFRAALLEAKVKMIAFHELRHSYATALLRNGAPPVVVAEALGHSDIRMVTKHYGHIPASFASETIRRAAPDLQAAA